MLDEYLPKLTDLLLIQLQRVTNPVYEWLKRLRRLPCRACNWKNRSE
jgi:hypothetical protein